MTRIFTIALIQLSLLVCAYAQTRVVSGIVRDENGAAIVGASVTLLGLGNTRFDTTTDSSGNFQITQVPTSGTLELRVFKTGFSQHRQNITGELIVIVLHAAAVSEQVTVTRTETRLGDTAASVVVLGTEELQTNPALTLDDKLRQVPGFTLFRRSGSRTANPTTQGVSLRGTGGSGASRAAVVVDGVALNDPFGGWIYWGRVPTTSLSSAEVLRGAAGDIYGSNSIGGAVALTTRRSDGRVLDLEASAGSHDTASVSMFTAAALKKFDLALAGEALRTDGFVLVADDQRGVIDTPAGVRRSGFSPSIGHRFSGNVRFFARGEYYQETRKNGTPLQNNDTRLIGARAGADIASARFGAFGVRTWLLAQDYHQSFTAVATDRNSETLNRLQMVPSEAFGASVQWTKSFPARATLFTGAEARVVRGSSDEAAIAAGRLTTLSGTGGRELTFGAFAGGSYNLTSRLLLSGGLRFDRWREYSAYSFTRPLPTGAVLSTHFGERSESAVSPRGSVLIRINDHLSITGSVSTGFRQPTLNELYRAFRVGNVITLANENLRAERSVNGEAGVIVNSWADRFFLRAVAFCARVNRPVANVTLSVAPNLITRQRQNLGSTRSCGIEADAQLRIRQDLDFSAGYLFVDARVTSFPVDALLEGLRVPQVARNQFTFQARYSNKRVATISTQLRVADSQFDDDQNLFELNGFAVVDVFASRDLTRNLTFFLAAENIFDSTIEAGRTPIVTITGPRSIRTGIRVRLGKALR